MPSNCCLPSKSFYREGHVLVQLWTASTSAAISRSLPGSPVLSLAVVPLHYMLDLLQCVTMATLQLNFPSAGPVCCLLAWIS